MSRPSVYARPVRSNEEKRKVNQQLFTLDEKTLEGQMKSLSSTTSNVRAAKKICRNKDTIHGLLDALNTKPKFTKMVEYSLECLKNLAVDEVSIEEMVDEGTLDVLANIMKLNPYNEKIQQMANKTLQSFAVNDRIAALIAEKMGPAGFVFSMKKHVEPETLSSTCAVVAKLMRGPASIDMFVQGGVISGLKHVIHSQEQNAEVLIAAAQCLDRISDQAVYCQDVMESGVVPDLLAALEHFPENSVLVGHAMSLVGKLAATSTDNLQSLRQLGAVDTMVSALEVHPDSDHLNSLGATALKLLAGQEDMNSAFKVAAGNTPETANALAKMSSLLLVDENVDYLINNQGVAWLISALNEALPEHSEVSSKILINGCRALMRLAKDENKIYGVMQQGGVKLLVSIVEGHLQDEGVAVSSINAVARMVTRKENAIYIVKSGGVRATMAALVAHPHSERVAKSSLELLQKLAAHEDCVAPLVEAGVIASVLTALKNHSKNPTLACGVITTLGRMALSPEILREMADAGAIQQLVSLLVESHDNAEVARLATLLLETCALVPENIERLRSLGAMDAILGVMEAHPLDADLQAIGSRTLAMMAGEAQLRQAVEYVAQLSDAFTKNPGSSLSIIDKLANATKLVGNLAMIDGNIASLQKSGAVKSMIGSFHAAAKMEASAKRSALLAQAAHGLYRLAKDPAAVGVIVQSGALKSLLEQALRETDNDELAEYAAALAALAAADPIAAQKMIDQGGIDSLLTLAKTHALNEHVLASVVKALSQLASTDEVAARICLGGGATVAVESVLANLLDKERLLDGLRLVNQMCVDEECIQKLVDSGAIDALLDAMRAHPNDPLVLAACMQSLCRLLISEEVARLIGEKGGLALCVKAMREHYDNESLCEIDMILLDSLASIAENVQRLLEPELSALDLIKWIGTTYPQNGTLQEALARLLESLTATEEDVSAQVEDLVVTDESFDSAQINVVMSQAVEGGLEKAESMRMLSNLVQQMQDPKNAELMMIQNNGGSLTSLVDMIDRFKDDEDLFYAASSAFLALTESAGDKVIEMLEQPEMIRALCNMINAHEVYATPMNLTELTKAVSAAAQLKMKDSLVQEMLKNKPLDSLMKIFTQSDDPMLLAQAARLLSKLSNNGDAAVLLSKIANLRELIQAIRRNMKQEEFLKYGVYLLGNLALNDDLKGQIGIEGGIQVILQILDTYPLHEGLVENCCFSLAELSFGNEVNVSFIVACKGVQLLLNAMHNHPKAADLLDHAVSVLCNLCQNSANNKDLILKLGGAQAIVDTVLNNFQALEFLQTSFRTLGNLAYDAKSVTSIIRAGGVQGLVAGMTVHNEDMEIIDIAIRVLSNLAQDATPDNMAIMAQEGAVQAIVEAAANYTDKLDIEISALGCLCNLGRQLSNAAMIIKQGGTEATIQAMLALDFDANLMAAAFRLLNILAHSQPAELEKMHEAGITSALVSGVKKQATNRMVLSNAMSAFTLLSYNSENAERMGGLGSLQVILKVVQDNISNQSILSDCFPALSALARSEGNAVSMSELAMNALSTCITTPNAEARFLNTCFAFLANLCVHAQASEGIMRTSLIANTIAVLHKHVGTPDILIRGLKACENCAYSGEEVKQHLRNAGLVEGVNKITTDNSALDDVRRAAKAVLDALNRADINVEFDSLKAIHFDDTKIRSVREIMGDEKKTIETVKELPEAVRNFLTAGAMLMKHSNTANPRLRHVYVTTDLTFLVWKDPKKPLHPDNKMKISRIRGTEVGRCTPQLERKSFGKFLAKEECAFAVLGRDRTVDVEASSEKERDNWINAIEVLLAYKKEVKRVATQFQM